MKAIAKVRPGPGVELIDAPEPELTPGKVRIKVQRASVCGTDVHIYRWDDWAAGRMKPPVIVGHEFCGVIEEVGEGVSGFSPGDYIAGESHIICGHCLQCRLGQGHVCQNTKIFGVDVDGCFAPYVVAPAANCQKTDLSVPPEVATVQDPLGNAVHSVSAAPVNGAIVLITGCGPIGLFSIAVAKALGAAKVIVTEVSPFRLALAEKMGADVLINPSKENAAGAVNRATAGIGADVALEMSGHPSALPLIAEAVRPGGFVSLLGIYSNPLTTDWDQLIFKGLTLYCVIGRRLYETWELMRSLLANKRIDITPAITHRLHYTEVDQAMRLIAEGECGKIVFEVD